MSSGKYLRAKTADALINECVSALDALIAYVEENRQMIEAGLNERTNWHWTIGQIFEHMNQTNVPYKAAIEGVPRPPTASGAPVRFSLGGKFFLKMMFNPNVPAPKQLEPSPKTYGPEVIEAFVADCRWSIEFARSLEGRDLSKMRFRNPFVKLFTMNACDEIAVGAAHAERHVAQIRDLLAKPAS